MKDGGVNLKNHIATLVYAVMIGDLQKIALEHGYALAFHGSMQRDFDLIAVPWTEDASSPLKLIYDLMPFKDKHAAVGREEKPHGRQAYLLPIEAGLAIDISIIPPENADARIQKLRELLKGAFYELKRSQCPNCSPDRYHGKLKCRNCKTPPLIEAIWDAMKESIQADDARLAAKGA